MANRLPYLDASAARDHGSLVLNVVNRHRDQSIEAEVELQDKQFPASVAVSEINGPDIKAENDFNKTAVKTVERSVTAERRILRYSFPPHSFTMLKASVT
jgi:alpha-N-arabinofuranosidase